MRRVLLLGLGILLCASRADPTPHDSIQIEVLKLDWRLNKKTGSIPISLYQMGRNTTNVDAELSEAHPEVMVAHTFPDNSKVKGTVRVFYKSGIKTDDELIWANLTYESGDYAGVGTHYEGMVAIIEVPHVAGRPEAFPQDALMNAKSTSGTK
jgi:hypothetical protein